MRQSELKYENLAERLADLIRQGIYRPGERIPSVREMSRQHGVSVGTVVQAYVLLEAQGWIEARPQSGFYVRQRVEEILPEPQTSFPHPDPTEVSLHELVMMLLRDSQNQNLIQLGAALPNPEYLPLEKINRLLIQFARQHEVDVHRYQFPPGLDKLRVQIARRLVGAGCNLSPNDILITSGGIEAIDLCLRAVCRPGDIVAVESPIYFGTLQTLEVQGLRALEIPCHPHEGMSLDALTFALQHNQVRAVLVSSNFSNPLGSQMPDEKKKALVDLLNRHEIPLIENDVFGEIYFGSKRPIVCKAFDKKELVLLVSSFSKDISPGLRVGWVSAGQFHQQVAWLKSTVSAASPTLAQHVIAEFLAGGGYDQHVRRIRREYARNIELMSSAVMRYFPAGTRLSRPAGGFVLWVQLPEGVDALRLYKVALSVGITLTPGHVFSASGQFNHFIRLNAAEFNYLIEKALETLGNIIKGMMTENH